MAKLAKASASICQIVGSNLTENDLHAPQILITKSEAHANRSSSIFDNLPEYISPDQVASLLPIQRSTVYDWNYRPKKYDVPDELLKKFGRKLMVRTSELKKWLDSRNSRENP